MTRLTRPAIGAVLALTVALGAGCGAETNTATSPTSLSDPTPTTSEPVTAAQALLDEWAGDGRGGVAVALAGDDEQLIVLAAGTSGPGGGPLEDDSAFRVGSLSKTFVAVMLLQAVDEGILGLDDPVVQHAPDLTIAEGVSVRQLLAHRSGIPEHTDGELVPAVLADLDRTWTPSEVLHLVAGQPRDFEPGERFAYSNTNYVVAGLLLAAVTGASLQENLSSRIAEPLGLSATYFAPDETRAPIGGFSRSLPGGDTGGGSYRALETAAGAAGALVSTAGDLSVFIRALAHGELLSEATYAQMTQGLPEDGHSLGVFASDPPSTTGIAHGGAIPGFTASMQYDPATEDLLVLLLNNDSRSPERLGTALSQIVADL